MVRRPLTLALWFVPAFLALALTGCQPSAGATGGPRGNILRTSNIEDYRTLDPAIAFDAGTIPYVRLIYQCLLDYDDKSELEPVLAEALPTVSEDRRTYTFKIRKGVHFSNGRELTAEDFKSAWERVLNPKTKSPCTDYLSKVVGASDLLKGKGGAGGAAGLRTPDHYTLVVELQEPDPTFPNITAMCFASAIPPEVVEKWGEDFFRHPVGTGPFVLDEWRRNVRLRFKRNPDYWDKAHPPALDGVDVMLGVDASTAQMMFERGEMDLDERIPPADYVRVKKDPHWAPFLDHMTLNSIDYVTMNCEMEPFKDKRVRQAFSYAIDKDRIFKLLNKRCEIAQGVLPPNMPGYNPDLKEHPRYPHDPEMAKKLLAEAGHAHDLAITIWIPTGNTLGRIGESVQQDLQEVGVKVDLNPVAYPVFLEATGKRNEVACSISGWSQDYPDPSDFLEVLYAGDRITDNESSNASFFNDPAVNEKLKAAASEADPKKRLEFYQEAEKLIVEEAPAVFLESTIVYRMRQPWVKGDRMDPVWMIRYEKLSLDQP